MSDNKAAVYPLMPCCPHCFQHLPQPDWFSRTSDKSVHWRAPITVFCENCKTPVRSARFYTGGEDF